MRNTCPVCTASPISRCSETRKASPTRRASGCRTRGETVHRLAGIDPIWNEDERAVYARGSARLTDPSLARPLDELLADLARSQGILLARFAALTPDDLAQEVGKEKPSPRGWQLLFFNFHEAYHAGQVGLLRRLGGHDGVLR